ncbi:diacylglycerol lipase-alpha-like [Arctopsyche grandis]|uniref:diacylglycerol lipase-alpha-like n=1 Tax=Arctopsyche grandis TaxID=121162 RepID=UPI00406D7025
MPGLVVFGRRWAVGSDDLVVPGAILFTLHFLWCIALGVILGLYTPRNDPPCSDLLLNLLIGHMTLIVCSALTEFAMCAVSMRGSILDAGPRSPIQKLIYARLVVLVVDIVWLSLSIAWLSHFYVECDTPVAKEALLGLVVSGWCVVGSVFGTCWCTWDAAGRSWVKLKRYQRAESRLNQRRSGSRNRNWRQRKVLRAYQDSWDHRCRILFCCMRPSDRNRSSFTDIARLLSDFFRELDVVPSDVVAGLVLLRQFQKIEQQAIVKQRKNDVYEFLSGVPVTSKTQFLALNDPAELDMFQKVVHYMHYALGAYGWPMFLMTSSAASGCRLCASLRCCCSGRSGGATVVHDNCCQCNYTALRQLLQVGDVDITYATYHVDVAETPFFIAVDHEKKTVVVSIRGTLSMKDVLTDLNAEGEQLPITPPIEDWFGHKGMVQAAEYILKKLQRDELLEQAFNSDPERFTNGYQLVLVGHSLGAGTAAILAILLRPQYPDLQCYSYSPPGGLLSMPAVQYSKAFTTSVVLGKDVVPRIGLHQLEALRADLINAIQRSVDPKWKTIVCSAVCCCNRQPRSAVALSASGATGLAKYQQAKDVARSGVIHPESGGTLTLHRPLLPPGRILHLVRHHPGHTHKMVKKREPVYQAVWAENTDFDEVLISPGMIQDHMPDKVLEALNKVISHKDIPTHCAEISNNLALEESEKAENNVIDTRL